MKGLGKLVRGGVLGAGMLLAGAPVQADILNIGLDMSRSAPLVSEEAFAARAASFVEARIRKLSVGDRVQLRTFGTYGMSAQLRRLDLKISRKNRADEVAQAVAKLVRAIPSLVEQGKLESEGSTNIVGYLEGESYLLDCRAEPVEFILLTDGVESSSYVGGQTLMSGAAGLPAPESGLLDGCSMTFAGIGQLASGGSPAIAKTLIAAWRVWGDRAGVSAFRPLPQF